MAALSYGLALLEGKPDDWVESAVILLILLLNAVVGTWQERSAQSALDALQKLHAAGLKTSVMILHGLGGKHLSEQHVAGSAKLIRAAPPNYLSTLVVSFPMGEERHASGFADAAASC